MKIDVSEDECVALIEKSDSTHHVRLSYGPGWATLDTEDEGSTWALVELANMREAMVKADEGVVRAEVLAAVNGCLHELYFKNNGLNPEIRRNDAEEITNYVLDAFDRAREKIAKSRADKKGS